MTIDRSPSHIANYFYMREFKNQGIVADKKNADRYPEFYQEERSGYQGALVNLFLPGLHDEVPLMHIDFKSMYPANMICFNYSPESLLWTKIDPNCQLSDEVVFNGNEVSVRDKYLGVITVKVDLSKESISKTMLKEFMADRAVIKKDPKLNEQEKFSQQWAVKVIMNAIPGYNGMGYAKCGCFPIAAHITAEGRWEITNGTAHVQKEGGVPIERDTDGLYYLGEDMAEEVAEVIRGMIPTNFESEVINLSTDKYDAGIFYDEKGYILKEGQKIIYHGSGLKGRHLPKVCDSALEEVTQGIFKHDDVIGILNGLKPKVKRASMEDFLMTVKMSKDPEKYSEKNQYGKLVAKAKAAGMEVRWGDEFQYLKTVEGGFEPFGAVFDKPYRIDYDYYLERIANVLVRPLKVTHGYIQKTVLAALKGGRIF
jgi:DNA polymerase elongation subunit (family B)